MKSIEYAEKKLGTKMATPQKVKQNNAYSPVKYDVEDQSGQRVETEALGNMINSRGAGDCDLKDANCLV